MKCVFANNKLIFSATGDFHGAAKYIICMWRYLNVWIQIAHKCAPNTIAAKERTGTCHNKQDAWLMVRIYISKYFTIWKGKIKSAPRPLWDHCARNGTKLFASCWGLRRARTWPRCTHPIIKKLEELLNSEIKLITGITSTWRMWYYSRGFCTGCSQHVFAFLHFVVSYTMYNCMAVEDDGFFKGTYWFKAFQYVLQIFKKAGKLFYFFQNCIEIVRIRFIFAKTKKR